MTDYIYRGAETLDLEEAWERAHNGATQPPKGPTLHGTSGAYYRHKRAGEKPCEPCHYAEMRRKAIKAGRQFTGQRKNLGTDKCGTIYGYQLHRKAGEDACFKCRVASAEHRARYPDKRSKQYRDTHPQPQPAPSDMSAAHKALRARLAERIENLEDLISAGVPDEEAATRAGWPTVSAAARALQRAGHPYGNRLDRTMRATRRQQAKDAA